MAPAGRRRRPTQTQEESSEEDEEPRRATQKNGRRAAQSEDETEEDEEEEEGEEEMEVDPDADSQDQVVKKLVRYALACEYQRISIKRTGITEKVIGKQRGAFKRTFEAAQKQLRSKFGMEMVELPAREKVTMKEKRAANKTKTNSKAAPSYVLTSILPPEYRTPEIIPPSIVGSAEKEAVYIGLCTMIVTLISLSPGGAVPDHKLMHLLKQLNADENTPLDKTSTILSTMIKQGYIVRTVEKSGDEETIDWRVGPRGKVEISNKGIQGFVQEIYGDDAPDDLEARLQRSLKMEVKKVKKSNGAAEVEAEEESEEEQERNGGPGPSTVSRRSSGRRR